jgi:hypothetical protein
MPVSKIRQLFLIKFFAMALFSTFALSGATTAYSQGTMATNAGAAAVNPASSRIFRL